MKVKAGGTILGLLFIIAAICKEGGGPWLLEALGWIYWGINLVCGGTLWVIHNVIWVINNFHNWF
ncbi:MAG: hypothetical protein ACYC44_01775 [Patescibacteria group bacterium]